MNNKQTSKDAALNALFDTEEQESPKALYEFNFEDINLEDVEVQGHELPQQIAEEEEKPQEILTELTPEQEEKRQEKVRRKRERRKGLNASIGFFTWVKDLVVAGLILWIVFSVAGFESVKDTNMDPTLVEGEQILVFKYSYKFASPKRGELVAIYNTASDTADLEDNGVFYARVIGLPGDKIYINGNGQIYLNDILFETKYCNGTTGYVYGEMSYPYVVPEDSFFVLSDNPASTIDSRYGSVRAVALEEIEGKVICCFWPQESWRPIH